MKSKVEKIVLEMNEGNMPELVTEVRNRALAELLEILPAKIEELFQKRVKEVDKQIMERVDYHSKKNNTSNSK